MKKIFPFALVIPLLIVIFIIGAKSTVHADSPSQITGCLSSTGGVLYDFLAGSSPRHSCPSPDDQVSLGAGDITSVLTTGGLTGGGTSGDLTVSIADGGVTPDKISNNASESSRIQTWADNSTDYTYDATGGTVSHHTITTDISVTVPTGKAYNYIVMYDGGILYNYSDRHNSSNVFYANWSADVVSDSTVVSESIPMLSTAQQNWSSIGGGYWSDIYHASWPVRITAGTHTIGIELIGYSADTMSTVHFRDQHVQLLRVF
ncbi:MAG TPA: hypothetical protein VLG12_01755 [Candidatus Saccharimonadales bacterium]|nr:hypothetical protein [Candidatus Saccharimonadales bacterium]